MEVGSKEELFALAEYKKTEQIQKLEKKLNQLQYIPLLMAFSLLVTVFFLIGIGVDVLSPIHLISVAAVIGAVGSTNVARTDLLKQLFELKYGK
jgi:uncharacterized membrane protein